MKPHVFAYLEDVIIVSDTFDDHLRWPEITINRLNKAGLTFSPSKCKFCQSEVKYLGFKVNKDGLIIDDDKVRPILDYPRPKNIKQMRRFVGATSWYRRFIQDYAKISEPLTRLTKKSLNFNWGDEQEKAFQTLRSALTSSPILAYPDFHIPFCVQTDASDYGLGVVVTQVQDEKERVIAFASKVMSSAERNYSTTEKECLAVVWAIKKFRHYLEGYHFSVIIDHSSLKWLYNLKNSTGRLARWALDLLEYDFEIIHRKGAIHHLQDALSRMYENQEIDKLSAWMEGGEWRTVQITQQSDDRRHY